MSAKQKAHMRAKLKKAVKKNPAVIRKRSFLKQASLVNFKLPVTVRLRTGDIPATTGVNEAATNNTNSATLDLGASLGQREVDLGGSLPAEIAFKDSYDGGALGNVDLEILPSATKTLTSTSIPLLWNTQVSGAGTRYDANFLGLPNALSGCGNFTGSSNLPFGPDNVTPPITIFGAGLPGFPFYNNAAPLVGPAGAPQGFLPVDPGVDNINNLAANKDPGNVDSLGGNPSPFPSGSAPGGFSQPPSVKDSVLRTAPLSLGIAPAGTPVPQSAQPNGVTGSQDITIGKSGGQANLFGNIPGKAYGIDVTVSLATRINSILRITDQDPFGTNLREGDDWPAGVFACRQVYTGAVQNYIPDVKLQGSLKISPAITADGKLRIAKATLKTGSYDASRFAVAACLVPYASFNAPQNGSDGDPQPSKIPTPTGGLATTGSLPSDVDNYRPLSSVTGTDCNAAPTGLVKYSALSPATVNQLTGTNNLSDGFTVGNSGSVASVAADLKVNNVSADILVGDA